MNADLTDLFGEPLGPDPRFALHLPVIKPPTPGPRHRTQFVIEFVGPRSAPASMVAALLHPNWHSALGQPEAFATRAADTAWQRLTPDPIGSYDAIALGWDVLSPKGQLSGAASTHLLAVASQFGSEINRRAVPMPPPEEVDLVARGLREAQNVLDIGISLMVVPREGSVRERDLWVLCAKLGLEFSGTGSFDWRSDQHPMPLFSVTPIGDTDAFSLGQVKAGVSHEGVTIGFSVPLCPDPEAALEASFKAADAFAMSFNGIVADDSGNALDQPLRQTMRRDLHQATVLMVQQHLAPGSAAALSLFQG